jgi:hypothetical protein
MKKIFLLLILFLVLDYAKGQQINPEWVETVDSVNIDYYLNDMKTDKSGKVFFNGKILMIVLIIMEK